MPKVRFQTLLKEREPVALNILVSRVPSVGEYVQPVDGAALYKVLSVEHMGYACDYDAEIWAIWVDSSIVVRELKDEIGSMHADDRALLSY